MLGATGFSLISFCSELFFLSAYTAKVLKANRQRVLSAACRGCPDTRVQSAGRHDDVERTSRDDMRVCQITRNLKRFISENAYALLH